MDLDKEVASAMTKWIARHVGASQDQIEAMASAIRKGIELAWARRNSVKGHKAARSERAMAVNEAIDREDLMVFHLRKYNFNVIGWETGRPFLGTCSDGLTTRGIARTDAKALASMKIGKRVEALPMPGGFTILARPKTVMGKSTIIVEFAGSICCKTDPFDGLAGREQALDNWRSEKIQLSLECWPPNLSELRRMAKILDRARQRKTAEESRTVDGTVTIVPETNLLQVS